MDMTTTTGAVNSAPNTNQQDALQKDYVRMCRDALSEVANFVTLTDDPDLPDQQRLHWLRVIAMVQKDI